MSLPPNTPVNLGLIGALDRLGLKSANIPGVLPGIQPVLVLGDIHDSIASELIETRKTAGNYETASFPFFRLQCLSAGGLVVESLAVLRSDITVFPVPFVLATIGPNVWTPGVLVPVSFDADIGGVASVSIFASGASAVSPFNGANPNFMIQCWNAFTTPGAGGNYFFWGEHPTRIWLRSGEFLSVYCVDPFVVTLAVQIAWRELTDIQGAT